MTITPVIISKNAMRTIDLTLNSLREFDEVVVLDTGSSDNTMRIAKEYSNVKLFQSSFSGFGKCKNEGANLATSDWILSIDADEVLSPELIHSIKALKLDSNKVYKWKRSNFYRRKEIRHSGWGNDIVIRLYNKKTTQFKEKLVHEFVESEGLEIATLNGCMNHYSYQSISEFSLKREFYSDLFAIENKGKRKSSPLIALLHAIFDFFNTFLIKRGFLDGYLGLVIAISNSYVTFVKYIKLYEANLDVNLAKTPPIPILVFKPSPVKITNTSKKIYGLELLNQFNESELAKSKKVGNSILLLQDEN